MNDINDGGPAFPGTEANGLNSGWSGLSLRDYFATNVVSGLCANQHACPTDQYHFDNIAEDAYRMADAMLRAREGSAS